MHFIKQQNSTSLNGIWGNNKCVKATQVHSIDTIFIFAILHPFFGNYSKQSKINQEFKS